MEIKYKNTVEDIEFLLGYFTSRFLKPYFYLLYFICIVILFSSGIYSSYKKNTILYFFTNSVALTIIVPYVLIKSEPRYIKKVTQKEAIKKFNSEKYFSIEKYLNIDNNLITVTYESTSLELELNKNTIIDVLEEYILIIDIEEKGYKKKLIIPTNVFKNEEKEEFINLLKLNINN
ncbi:hypothetical protein [Clostridium sp. HCS.1]|uniref:hypothetical protein n=1 Tax=Clostridium sp. HCS.1 TaxID=3238594 RepID=UPI003A0FFCEE